MEADVIKLKWSFLLGFKGKQNSVERIFWSLRLDFEEAETAETPLRF